METVVKNHNSYVIHTEEGVERGLFFRSPIQKVEYTDYCVDGSQSAWAFLDRLKSPLRRLVERIIGNGKIVKHGKEWAGQYNFGCFLANKLCFPVYFKRVYRSLVALSQNPDDNIQEVRAKGYESEYNVCSGCCVIERTTIRTKSGKKIKAVIREKYHYTYRHIVEKMLDTQ